MSGRMESAGRRRIGPLLAVGTIGALVLGGAAACASSGATASSSDSSSIPVVTGSSPTMGVQATTWSSPSPSASSSGTSSASPSSAPVVAGSTTGSATTVPGVGGIVVSPKAQVSATPTSKLTAFTSAAHSEDGRTLYLGIESQGGACGQYEVVLQQSSTTVSVGLVHLPAGTRVCPMYVTHMLVEAKLSAPLERRRVIDLANGQIVASPQVG